MTTIDDVKSRLDIVDVVSGYVPELKKAGRTYKAPCPFHNERTPSFVVDPERQTWHCFGACSTGGDVLEFVRRREGLDFKEALRLCAERAGVELRPPTQREVQQREQYERLLQANEAAAVFFASHLKGADGAQARAYCDRRGLDEAAIETWQLGYAPDDWRTLTDHLVARGFTEDDIVDSGLAIRSENGRVYDRFRNRLMFPTRDARRRLIGFGARALNPEDEPKYLNTPQTPLFDKSGNLYGLDRANDDIRRGDRAVVVEGYMDVIAAHTFGFTEVVASNGTAITEKQMDLLKRYTHNVVLALDADNAGSAATLRGVEVAAGVADRRGSVSLGYGGLISYQEVLDADIRVVALPEGEDPDSLVRKDTERFRALLDGAKPVLDHIFEVITASVDAGDARGRSKAVETLVPYLGRIGDEVVRSSYVQKLARFAQVDEATILRRLAERRQFAQGQPTREPAGPRPVATKQEVSQAKREKSAPPDGEVQLLQLIVQRHESRGAGLSVDPGLFEDSLNRAVYDAWVADIDLDEHADTLEPDIRERYDALCAAPLPEYEARHVPEMVTAMARELRTRRQQQRLQAVLREQAEALKSARRGSTSDAPTDANGAADEPVTVVGEVADEFIETTRRQRALTRSYQVAAGIRSAEDGDFAQAGERGEP
ncbi:MAG: DNA primase [Dehalococcoidia bacterium]|nr:DNA primase [Dehalococcoidia bacterium]